MSSDISIGDLPVKVLPKIVVFGVGGAGINSVNNMILSGLDNVKFIVANTDCQSLSNSLAECKIQLGAKCTKGLGAGANPEIGRQSAEEAIDMIKREIADADMLFIATGMGGGTGTGASPVIAKIAHDLGILTVAIATKPFLLEGRKRMETANKGIEELERIVDTLIIIENQKLVSLANISMVEGFSMADSMLRKAVHCVVDILTKQGFINRDFADVKTVLSSMGRAVIGYGEDIDPKIATEIAIHNQILENNSISGAKSILLNITGNKNIKPGDIEDVINIISNESNTDNIIFGIAFDENLGNNIGVSIIAAGVENNNTEEAKKQDNVFQKEDNTNVNKSEKNNDYVCKDIQQEITENNIITNKIDEDEIVGDCEIRINTEEIPYNDFESLTQFNFKNYNNEQGKKKKIEIEANSKLLEINQNEKKNNINTPSLKEQNIKNKKFNNTDNSIDCQTLFDNNDNNKQKKSFFGRVLNAFAPNPYDVCDENIDDFKDERINDDENDFYSVPAIMRRKIG